MWPVVVIIVLAAILASGDAAPAAIGFVIAVAIGLLTTYRMGWNARGDYDAQQAHKAVDDKNKAGRM